MVLFGSRFELIARATERARTIWPQGHSCVVQLTRRDRQSSRVKPTYAVVMMPMGEGGNEPVSVFMQGCSRTSSQAGLRLRCTEADCPWRPESARPDGSSPVDEQMEFEQEDRVDCLETMLGECADL